MHQDRAAELDAQVLRREADFHDELASELIADPLPPRPPNVFERPLLDAARPVAGLRVLELGCGDGSLTLQLLEAGAKVTAIDISPGMVELTRARVARFAPGAPVALHVGPAEDTGLADGSCDIVVGNLVLHHLDLPAVLSEVSRVLAPGGRAVFMETSALNPVLAVARRHLTGRFGVIRVGTPDEHPISRRDLRLMRERFAECRVDHPLFILVGIFDRNVLRYRWPAVSRRVERLDRALGRVRWWLGPASFYMRIELRTASAPAPS